MRYNPDIHHRRSIRLKGYDYSQSGLYFITICVQNREYLFGEIINDEMILNENGKIIDTEWKNLENKYSRIELHEYVIMPNHFHAIIAIVVGAGSARPDDNTVNSRNNTANPEVGRANPPLRHWAILSGISNIKPRKKLIY
jgi:hypothetical protein